MRKLHLKHLFWWDTPEYNGCDDEDESKAPRPDGKLELVKENKFLLIEITIPLAFEQECKVRIQGRKIS